ncbi:MAG: hypothetical protein JNK72_01115 [Myxococcales bacterium]|nr:hypothetical protein [Myxococcales bacterium]
MPVKRPANVKVPVDHGQFGARQRYRAHVPSPSTTLILGERWKDDPPLGYNGITLHTVENFFVDITLLSLVQLRGNVVTQTPSNWQHYVTGQFTIQSAGSTTMSACTQIVVSSLPDTGLNPPPGADLQEIHGDPIPEVATYSALRDTFADDQTQALAPISAFASAHGSERILLGYAQGSEPITAANSVLSDDLANLKEGSDASVVGVGTASKTAVFTSTATTFDVQANGGVNLLAGPESSAEMTLLSGGDLHLRTHAKLDALASGDVTVLSAAKADFSAMAAATLASRTATAEVLAPTIQIGNQAPGSVAGNVFSASMQQPTNEITLAALQTVTIDSENKVLIDGMAEVKIVVGGFTITVTPSSCVIDSGIMGKIEVKGTTVDMSALLGKVGVTPASAKMSTAASSVTTTPAMVAISSPMIKLG